jgi:hypothetical protein
MSALAAIFHPGRPLAGAAACALPCGGNASGIGARGAAEHLQLCAAARAPRGAGQGPRSLELPSGRSRAKNDDINSKKETRS